MAHRDRVDSMMMSRIKDSFSHDYHPYDLDIIIGTVLSSLDDLGYSI